MFLTNAAPIAFGREVGPDPFERLHQPRITAKPAPAETNSTRPEAVPTEVKTTSTPPPTPEPAHTPIAIEKTEKKAEPSTRITGRIQVDVRNHNQTSYTADGEKTDTNTIVNIRRARVDVKGSLQPNIRHKFSIELFETVRVRDAFFDYEFDDTLKLRAGQFTYPFSLDNISSNRYYQMVEASLIGEALSPSRDRGIALVGKQFDKRLFYMLAAVNGTGAKNPDFNKNMDYVAQAAFLALDNPDARFRVWLGGYYGTGRRDSSVADSIEFKPETESTLKFFSADFPENAAFDRTRSGANIQIVFNSIYLGAEYIKTEYTFDQKAIFDGGFVQAGYFLTGEQRNIEEGFLERQPVKNPYGSSDGMGAFEIAARYSWFATDPILFEDASLSADWKALNADQNAIKGEAISVGLNWYPTKQTRVMLDYITTTANAFNTELGVLAKEEAYILRMQIEF